MAKKKRAYTQHIYNEKDLYEKWKAHRLTNTEKGQPGTFRAFIRAGHISQGGFQPMLRRWRDRLEAGNDPFTGEPFAGDASAELGLIGRHGETAVAKKPAPDLLDGTVKKAGGNEAAAVADAATLDQDTLKQLKEEARTYLRNSLRKKADPAKVAVAKAILAIKEEVQDKIPNPYAGMEVEEVVDRLLTSVVSLVGVKSVYKRLEWLVARGEAEVIGEVSNFKPEGASESGGIQE